MGFKKVNIGGIEDLVEFNLNQAIEGVYEGQEEYIAKNEYIFNLGKILIEGVRSRFFCGGQLKFLLAKVEVGAKVRITYLGLSEKVVKCKKGGDKQVHQYKVEVDDSK